MISQLMDKKRILATATQLGAHVTQRGREPWWVLIAPCRLLGEIQPLKPNRRQHRRQHRRRLRRLTSATVCGSVF